jgi:MFS family permease
MQTDDTAASMRTVVAASAVGTTIEWYDFLIYGTAASLVLNKLFFPTTNPLTGTLLSIGTIGVGFFARPIGAIILSHFGDRLGRKSMLILTLVSMGVATTIVGLLPAYSSIGIAAPILLVLCRLVQGIAVGCVAAILLSFPIFWGIESRDPTIVVLAFVIGMSVGHGIMYGVQASFLSEMFPSNLRYSGASLGYQIAAPIGGGLVPLAAAAMVGLNNGATWPVSLLMIVIAALTIIAVLFARETAPGVAAKEVAAAKSA